jgi:hypothetical protein
LTLEYRFLVYPDGDTQEAAGPLRINELVDLNGYPVSIPLRTHRMIVYRVYRIRREDERGEERTYYHLELVTGSELRSLAR